MLVSVILRLRVVHRKYDMRVQCIDTHQSRQVANAEGGTAAPFVPCVA